WGMIFLRAPSRWHSRNQASRKPRTETGWLDTFWAFRSAFPYCGSQVDCARGVGRVSQPVRAPGTGWETRPTGACATKLRTAQGAWNTSPPAMDLAPAYLLALALLLSNPFNSKLTGGLEPRLTVITNALFSLYSGGTTTSASGIGNA